jgi:hypothetical protein
MNEHVPCSLDDVTLDRLVDGELSRAEWQSVVAMCEQQPQAWRRVALAFLTAQAWRDDLTAFAQPTQERATSQVAPALAQQSAADQPAFRFSPRLWASIAAIFVLGLFCGWRLPWQTTQSPSGDGATVVAHEPQTKAPLRQAAVVATARPTLPIPVANAHLTFRPVTGATERIAVPVFDGEQIDAEALWQASAEDWNAALRAIDPEQKRLVRDCQLVPVSLRDGRKVVIPIESVRWERPESY